MSFFSRIFGGEQHTRNVKAFEPIVVKINALEESIKSLTDLELRAKTEEFRERLRGKSKMNPALGTTEQIPTTNDQDIFSLAEENKILADILPEAFAVVREASHRTLGQRHFDVQLMGGMVLDSGAIAEMRTGEGKTLVATLSAYLNALSGRGVHVVTVNDYLSRRDAVWMGQIYDFLGLSVGVINSEMSFLYDPGHRSEGDFEGVEGKVEEKDPSRGPASESADSAPTARPLRPPQVPLERLSPPLPPTNPALTSDPLDKARDITGGFKVVHEFLRPCTRTEAYRADITYGTNNEFGFDYLRDNLEYSPDKLRQREPHYAIVDEIDSILIDEARTPLIISAPTRDAESTYKQFASLVSAFNQDEDYTVDEKHRSISLTENGISKAEKMLGVENIYTDRGIKYVHHLETAVKARAIYHKDKEYVVKDNEIVIVDEFTGRLQPGRRWSDGLHQAIEAKEGVRIQQESRTYASITFQNFFRMYPKLSGMTGTAVTSSEEFYKVYGLEVYSVPTNKPAVRADYNDQIFRTELGKFKAVSRKIKELHDKGQPVLIGTVSIEKNELLSQFLKGEGVPHEVLNAKNHEREGEIIAQAGKKGAVTIATNMAGRGVDIKLGGNPNTKEVYEEIKSLGGLFVMGTERHEARRIDNQLRGRSGRQGDPGATQFFVSLEDSLMRVFASDMLKNMMGRLNMPEDEAIEHRMISKSLESAQEKIEGFNFDSRKHVLEFDDVINQQRRSVYSRRRKLLLGSVDDVEKELVAILGVENLTDGEVQEIGGAGEKALSPDSRAGVVNHEINNIVNTINKKITEFGRDAFLSAVRIILLQAVDMYWVEHLEVMDYTRSSVNLRAYGQRDPLVEYKKEGLRLFKEMKGAMRSQVIRLIPRIVPINQNTETDNIERGAGIVRSDLREVCENAEGITSGDGSGSVSVSSGADTPGRNDPCPCGSGKKYKKCHGK